MGPSYKSGGCATRREIGSGVLVGAGHARESDRSWRSASDASTVFAVMGRSYERTPTTGTVGDITTDVRSLPDQLTQPSSRIAHAACQIFVMCLILPPANSMQ